MAEIDYQNEKCWSIPKSNTFKAKLSGNRISFNCMEVSYEDFEEIGCMFQRNSIDTNHVLKYYSYCEYDYSTGECMFSFRTQQDAKEHFRVLSELDVFV